MRFRKMFWSLWVPLFIVIIVTAVLQLNGHPKAAFMVSTGGTVLALFGCIAYITFFDSKKRWPDLHWLDRLGRAMTFGR